MIGRLKRELDLMVELTCSLLTDVAHATGVSTERDAREVRLRSAEEGPSFLTKSLPALGKCLDQALSRSDGRMNYPGFKTRGGYPLFMGDLFRRLFDSTGRSLCSANACDVKHVRQILYAWYKYELPYTPAQKAELESRFIATEATLPDSLPDCPVLRGARDLVARVCSTYDRNAVVPRHGPGAVATYEQPWEKWRFKRLYRPIERLFPFSEWYIPSLSFLASHGLEGLEVLGHGTARAVFVPKDSRGPRLISCEPLEYQWIQQGIARELVRCINSCAITSGRVNFAHQEVNGRYALLGSAGAGWVTLDMADASDRVSLSLVERLFGSTHVLEDLLASRSQCTVLPSGKLVHLRKFAPMGSALCFPVESLVFFALAANVLIHHGGLAPEMAYERIKVYGDDIVVSLADYEAIMQYFPIVGLLFNEKKCCTGGLFRESCGTDAYSGVDVTPVRFRTRCHTLVNPASLISWVEYSNALYARGYWSAAALVEDWCGVLPTLEMGHSPVSFLHYRRALESIPRELYPMRWSKKLHRREIMAYVVEGREVVRPLTGWDRLFANLADSRVSLGFPCRNVLRPSRSGWWEDAVASRIPTELFPVRRRVTRKRRWCPV
jgi:hypothetical protein